jgi:hypothetical protein
LSNISLSEVLITNLESRFGAVFFSRAMVFDNDDDTFYK